MSKTTKRPNYNEFFFRRSKAVVNDGTRQGRRLICRIEAWRRWIVTFKDGTLYAPKDDRGVMPRRVRRSIAISIARQAAIKLRDTFIAQQIAKV